MKQQKEQPAKRLKSPAATMSPLIPARSTGIRMMLSSPRVSPRLMSPSTTLANSRIHPPTSTLDKKRNNLDHGKCRCTLLVLLFMLLTSVFITVASAIVSVI